ncbi:receptor-type tyrosine-protein phosphatase epsilon-like [Actinia tenebrosa]|uniref:protein-tyrosine-phosphatase n=1 Tax=Actinia tenebrosa TaxID=6105 RepID=A0A6P8I3X0_ACTTE|nr:receptor-type tyrosine-protein phosphatase epsilon-like [Actinia tenebrosa]
MIWEQSVSSIVMLTNLRELGKKKCYQYWPDDCDQYSDITITNHKTEVFADFTIRTFFLSKAGSQNRRVRQFHFTAWPDKGVPDHATAVLSFRRKVLALSSSDNSRPTVVHCSAGVGRTGTYIMIDAMLRQAEEQQHVDILDYLRTIRNDRPYMVQTVEQYIFVNMAIYDALTCGNTEVPVQNLLYAIQQLSVVDRRHKLTGYALEFQRLEDVTSEDIQSGNFDVGLSRKNVKKNRYPNIVAANGNRVILSTENDTEIGDYINSSVIEAYKERKGDYINASFVDTYREHNAFIMTQAPMENTIADFWRMVMDYKIGTIVMLNNSEEEREVFPQYWPLHEAKTYDSIKVRLVETKHLAGNIILRILKVSNRKKQLTVNHFQHLTWENECVPTNPQSVLTLLHEVQKSQQKSGNSPIVVQCSNGVGRSGTFCAIASCLERVKQEQVLDVFQTVKSIRVNRPGAVETLTQYVFCYNIIQKYLDSFSNYANFGDVN